MTIQDDNLAAIERYYFTARERRALAFLEESTAQQRAETLETHLLHKPSPAACDQRDDLDFLLRYFSVLELATISGAIGPLPETTAEAARRQLEDRYVRRYYEWYYPLLLPQLFRARLAGCPLLGAGRGATDSFLRLVALDPRRDDEETQTFLQFLDDRVVHDGRGVHDLASTMRTVAQPELLLRALAGTDAAPTLTEMGVRGLLSFLSFSRALHALLKSVDDAVVRSAYWHYHGYWYQVIGGRVLGALLTGIQTLAQHVADESTTADEERETYEDMAEAARSLQVLTSSTYRGAVETLVFATAPGNLPIPADPTPVPAAAAAPTATYPEAATYPEIDLNRAIVEVADMYRQAIDRMGLTLELDLVSEPVRVHTHPGHLQEAISNLLHNAVQYTPSPGRVVLASTVEGGQAVVRVVDNGVGISQKALPKVFEFSLRDDAKVALGLPLVKEMVDRYGGTVAAESAGKGMGTAVTVRLPRAELAASAD